MRPTTGGQEAAREAVRERMRSQRIYDGKQLAEAADLDPDTVNDFLTGKRWPRPRTRIKIEEALELTPGTIDALASSDEAFLERHAAAGASPAGSGAKTLDDASDVELLMALLARATARLGEDNARAGN